MQAHLGSPHRMAQLSFGANKLRGISASGPRTCNTLGLHQREHLSLASLRWPSWESRAET